MSNSNGTEKNSSVKSGTPSKPYVKDALNYYAAFFAELASGSEESASKNLVQIKDIDRAAQKNLTSEDLEYYKHQRTSLMRVFRQRLMTELRGQVEQSILEKAEKLVIDFERLESEPAIS